MATNIKDKIAKLLALGRVPLRCCCGALLLPSLPLPERR